MIGSERRVPITAALQNNREQAEGRKAQNEVGSSGASAEVPIAKPAQLLISQRREEPELMAYFHKGTGHRTSHVWDTPTRNPCLAQQLLEVLVSRVEC